MSARVPQEPGRSRRLRRIGGGTAKQRKTERRGTGGGKSEHLIVPLKQGQPPERPCGGKEVPSHGIVWRKDDGDTSCWSSRRRRMPTACRKCCRSDLASTVCVFTRTRHGWCAFAPPPSSPPSPATGTQRDRSFDLLGFTLYWGRSRKGRWVVMQKTARDRFRRSLRRVSLWCQDHRNRCTKPIFMAAGPRS